ncbi:hypothetical protein ABPG72_015948 [Tetrahymena utriculariae]
MKAKYNNNHFSLKESQKEADFKLIKYLKDNDLINFVIDQVSLSDNQSQYAEIINESIRNNETLRNVMDTNFISENSKEEGQKINNWLILRFDIIITLQNKICDDGYLQISNNDFRNVIVRINYSNDLKLIPKINSIHNHFQINSLRIPANIFQHVLDKYQQEISIQQIMEFEYDLNTNVDIFGKNKTINRLISICQAASKLSSQIQNFILKEETITMIQLVLLNKQTKLLQIKLKTFYTTFDQFYSNTTPKFTPFYKIKRLVHLTIEEDYLEDTRSEREGSYDEDGKKILHPIFNNKKGHFDLNQLKIKVILLI